MLRIMLTEIEAEWIKITSANTPMTGLFSPVSFIGTISLDYVQPDFYKRRYVFFIPLRIVYRKRPNLLIRHHPICRQT